MSKNENVGRSNSLYMMSYDRMKCSGKCFQRAHTYCSGNLRIENKKELILEKIHELQKIQDNKTKEELRLIATLQVLEENKCQCFCHSFKETRK